MHRIDTATRAVDLFGPGKHGFKNGNPLSGDPATALNAEWFNAVQEELANVVEGAATALDPAAHDQLLSAINSLIATATDAYVRRAGDTLSGTLSGPGGTYGTYPGRGAFNGRGNGNAIIFGHTNSEYASAIGALSGGGSPFFSFWCTHGEGANEMVRSSSSIAPSRLLASAGGDVLFQTAPVGSAGSIIAPGDWVVVGQLAPATGNEVQAGISATHMVTPAGLASLTATDGRRGLIELATGAEVQAGTDMSRAITPATLASFARSFNGSGYQRLPGGLILQWGQTGATIGANAQATVILPIAFPTAALQALACAVSSSTSGAIAINADIFNVSSITLHNSGATPAYGRYFILGY